MLSNYNFNHCSRKRKGMEMEPGEQGHSFVPLTALRNMSNVLRR